MTRLLLRAWNAPGLILLTLFGIAIQTSVFASYPLLYLQPDVVLLVVIWCALKRSFVEGGVIVLILADIAEVHSGCPQGLYLSIYMLLYLSIRGWARYFIVTKSSTLIILTMFASIFWKLSGLSIIHFLDLSANQWRHTLAFLLPGAIVQGVFGIWIYQLLYKYDWVTFKDPKSKRALEEELQLDEEGL